MAAEQAKERGNRLFSAGDFAGAASAFSEAVALHAQSPETPGRAHVYLSNRSAAYLKLGDAPRALADAEQCVALRPDWPKGFSRRGAALYQLGRFEDARRAYSDGLALQGGNAALLDGLRAVEARIARQPGGASAASAAGSAAAASPAAGPSASAAGSSLRAFLVGDAAASFRVFQSAVRALLLAQFVLYWLGARAAFARFFSLALLQYASFLAFAHGRPRLDAAYGQRLVLDPATQSLFFALVFWAAADPPHGLALLPVALVEAVQLAAFLAALLARLGPGGARARDALGRALVPLAAAVVREPGLAAMAPAARWAALYRRAPAVAAELELALGLALLLELLTPARNVLLALLFWQVLRVRYMISPPLQDAFRRLHAALRAATRSARCPAVVARAYDKLSALAWKMVEVNAAQPAAGAAGPSAARCSLM